MSDVRLQQQTTETIHGFVIERTRSVSEQASSRAKEKATEKVQAIRAQSPANLDILKRDCWYNTSDVEINTNWTNEHQPSDHEAAGHVPYRYCLFTANRTFDVASAGSAKNCHPSFIGCWTISDLVNSDAYRNCNWIKPMSHWSWSFATRPSDSDQQKKQTGTSFCCSCSRQSVPV